jgi:hypothetical protein
VRRTVVAVAVIALASGLASACGLTADYSGLQGGMRDAGGGDDVGVGVEAATEAGVDAGSEAAPPDAGFCASLSPQPQFCADFDEGQPVNAGWSLTDVWQGSSIAVDGTYYSPPGSFLSQIFAASSPGSARLEEALPTNPSHVHVEFRLLIPQIATGNFEVCTLHEPVANGTTYGVFYKYQDGQLLMYVKTLADDGGQVEFTGKIGPPPTGWLHVEIDTDVSPSATVVVKHDGAVVLNAPNVNTSTDTRASMFVELGYYSFNPATALAHFDDVVIDWN